MMNRPQLIIKFSLVFNLVLYERVSAVCNIRVVPGRAMIGKGYNGTPVQPQSQTMGAARRDPRRGEIPVGQFATGR